jgi:hypothetical protein
MKSTVNGAYDKGPYPESGVTGNCYAPFGSVGVGGAPHPGPNRATAEYLSSSLHEILPSFAPIELGFY